MDDLGALYGEYEKIREEELLKDRASAEEGYREDMIAAARRGLTYRQYTRMLTLIRRYLRWMESYRRVLREVSPTGKYISYGKAVAIHDRVGYFSLKKEEEADGGSAYQTFRNLTDSD